MFHISEVYFIIQSALNTLLKKYKYFIPKKELIAFYTCREWGYCVENLLDLKSVNTTESKRIEKMFNIINNLPRYSRCYPQIFCEEHEFAYGIFSVERTDDMIRLCRARFNYDVVAATYYYVTISDFIKVASVLDYKVSKIEIEPIWGWGLRKYYDSKLVIDQICNDETFMSDSSKHSQHMIHFDNHYTDGTFAVDRCAAIMKNL